MKGLITILFFACLACQKENDVVENQTFFAVPDIAFEKKLIALGIDSDESVNGIIKEEDALKVDTLIIAHEASSWPGEIVSLEGIEAFKKLKYLDCSGQSIEILDISKNLNLEVLHCGGIFAGGGGDAKQIKLIRVGDVEGLQIVTFPYSYVRDISFLQNQKSLEVLNCNGSNIADLDVRNNSKLRKLYANGCFNLYNGKIAQIDLSNNGRLEVVQVYAQGLPTICVADLKIDFDTIITDTIPNGGATGSWIRETSAWYKDLSTSYSICK